jgi:hypothetical protein
LHDLPDWSNGESLQLAEEFIPDWTQPLFKPWNPILERLEEEEFSTHKTKKLSSHDPDTEQILEDLVKLSPKMSSANDGRHSTDHHGGSAHETQPNKPAKQGTCEERPSILEAGTDSLEELLEKGSVHSHPETIEYEANTNTPDMVSVIGLEQEQDYSSSKHRRSRTSQRSSRTKASTHSNGSEHSRTSIKDIVKVVQMMERGNTPQGFSQFTTSNKAKMHIMMSEDDLRSIDNVVKICAARGSPPEVRKEDIVFFEDPITEEMRDPVPNNHRHNGGTEKGRCLEEASYDRSADETGNIDRIADGRFSEETNNDKFVKETRSDRYVKDNSNSNFSKHLSNSRDVEESRQDQLVEETRSDKYVEEDTAGNLAHHTRTVNYEDTIVGNFAKHSRIVKYVEDSEEATPFKKMESAKGETATKMGQCKTSAFEKTGSPDSVVASAGTCSTSDSRWQHRFENLHPIARMRYRGQMADSDEDCPYYY